MNGVHINLIRPAAAKDRHKGKTHEPSPPSDVESIYGVNCRVTLSPGQGVTITPAGKSLSMGAQTTAPTNMRREKAQEESL